VIARGFSYDLLRTLAGIEDAALRAALEQLADAKIFCQLRFCIAYPDILEHNGRPPHLPSERHTRLSIARRSRNGLVHVASAAAIVPQRFYRCVPVDRRRSRCSSPTKLGIRSSKYSKGDQPAGRSTHRRPHWSTNKEGPAQGRHYHKINQPLRKP
jgi:hypothetical protein